MVSRSGFYSAALPVSVADCGEPTPQSVAVSAAVAVPLADGLKAIETVQLAPAAKDVWQVLLITSKAPEFNPVT
jgi:hypothetical protein